jgi:enoyl-CoA hydratase/carnithine racemase
MTEQEPVLVRDRRGPVMVASLNRPTKGNALNRPLIEALAQLAGDLEQAEGNPVDEVQVLVITGRGAKAFCAGADVSELDGIGHDAAFEQMRRGQLVLDRIEQLPIPVIAAINGFALGGGLELALACDLRVCAESSRLGFPEIQLGIFPGGGGTQRAARLIGPAKTKDLVWSGRHVRADEALAIGLVDRVVPAEAVLDTALEWAGSLATGAVVAMGLAKRAIDRGLDGSLSDGLDGEAAGFVEVFATEDARGGIRSFLDDGPGKAAFSGR